MVLEDGVADWRDGWMEMGMGSCMGHVDIGALRCIASRVSIFGSSGCWKASNQYGVHVYAYRII